MTDDLNTEDEQPVEEAQEETTTEEEREKYTRQSVKQENKVVRKQS